MEGRKREREREKPVEGKEGVEREKEREKKKWKRSGSVKVERERKMKLVFYAQSIKTVISWRVRERQTRRRSYRERGREKEGGRESPLTFRLRGQCKAAPH